MSVLSALTEALSSATVEIVDLTAPLSSSTPVIKLPPPFSNTVTFALHEISRYDDRGPAWYWNDITTGEHTGTHFDAPCHWVSGRDGEDVSQVPAGRLIAPAVALDFSAQAAADPDFLLEVEHIKEWESAHGPLPEGGWPAPVASGLAGRSTRRSTVSTFLPARSRAPGNGNWSCPACSAWSPPGVTGLPLIATSTAALVAAPPSPRTARSTTAVSPGSTAGASKPWLDR